MSQEQLPEGHEIANLNIDDLNVEELEQRLELAVAHLDGLWDLDPLDCQGFVSCNSFNGACTTFGSCGTFKPVE